MKMSKKELIAEANHSGFRPEILEKVILLLQLLEQFIALPLLKKRVALKGGTALNLFCFDHLLRLSVDIDLNYIGSPHRETMLQERPLIDEAITAICRQNQLEVYRNPREHAGGKMVLRYQSALGHTGNLEIDMNYMYRTPLWDAELKNSHQWPLKVKNIPVLDIHELAAGKLHALFSRTVSRDLFDSHRLLTKHTFDRQKLRTAFIVYIGMSQRNWRTINIDNLKFDIEDLKNRLVPVLRKSETPAASKTAIKQWTSQLIEECREALAIILPFTDAEQAFLIKLQDHGMIDPALICRDEMLSTRILSHPALHWKIQSKNSSKK
jgi:predicted nucleotidyltransferase component of viral defense system